MATSSTPVARRWAWALAPLLLLGVLVAVLVRFGPLGVFVAAFPPVEELTIDRVTLAPGVMVVHVTNGGPQAVTVAQVQVDDAYWQFEMEPDQTVPRLGRATITLRYPWVEGETHHIRLLSSTGLGFEHTVEVATSTPKVDARYLATFTLLGVYVGVIPVLLGLLWFPFLRELDQRWISFFLSLTAGLLLFLGVDAVHEALDVAGTLPAAFQGFALVLVGVVITILVLVAISRRVTAGADALRRRLALAFFIALGIGLHNLGEGLAIGAAYSLGKIALGTFLVLGFTIHNTTEGLAIVAPIARDRPAVRTLVLLGALAGVPTILGTWVGGLNYSPVLATLFLAVGAGAIFQVVYELVKLMVMGSKEDLEAEDTLEVLAGRKQRPPVFLYQAAGFAAGLLVMYVTGLFVAA